jgi:hypothetical protein
VEIGEDYSKRSMHVARNVYHGIFESLICWSFLSISVEKIIIIIPTY